MSLAILDVWADRDTNIEPAAEHAGNSPPQAAIQPERERGKLLERVSTTAARDQFGAIERPRNDDD